MDVLLSSSSIQFAKRKHHAPIQITTVPHNSQIFICVNKRGKKKQRPKNKKKEDAKDTIKIQTKNLPN